MYINIPELKFTSKWVGDFKNFFTLHWIKKRQLFYPKFKVEQTKETV